MCNMCGIVSTNLRPESSYWRKMCEYVTGTNIKSFQERGCSASSVSGLYVKDVAGKKCFAIFDGVLSNYKNLRRSLQLKGAVFEGESPAELLLVSYFAFGKSTFNSFKGEFSAVIWDGYEQELVLLRDKIGFRPLFYYFDGLRLVFASKIKGVLNFPFVKKEFCDDIFCKLFTLAGSNLNFDTLFNKIYEVPPSSFVTYKSGRIKIHNYFMFKLDSTTDSFSQTVKGLDFLIGKKPDKILMTEKTMIQDELKYKIKEYVSKADLPSPYIDLNDLSNSGDRETFISDINLFGIPKRFRLPVKNCEKLDRELICDFLSTIPHFSYKDERDIIRKEQIYINISLVLPQVISAKRAARENIAFPYLEEQFFEYCLKCFNHKEKLRKIYFASKKQKPVKENFKVLKKLFYDMLSDKNAMLGFIQKEELLRFIRLFPRPETMLYLLQVNEWLNMFL